MDEQQIMLGIISMFKIIENPGSADMVGMPDQFIRLVDEKLPTLFSSMKPTTEVVQKVLDFREPEDRFFIPKYLLVLGQLCRVLGTQCYTREILETGRLEPKQEVIIVACQTEAAIMYHLARYLYTMHHRIWERVKVFRPQQLHPKEYQAEFTSNFYYQIIRVLQPRLDYRGHHITKLLGFTKRYDNVLHYLINNYKFDYSNKEVRPEYGDTLFPFERFIIRDGKFRKHSLLWA